MKRLLITYYILKTISISYSQINLVPNPSFEQYDTCPNTSGEIRRAIPWTNPLYYTTPDYYNSCNTNAAYVGVPGNFAGYENARTGKAYSGIVTYTHNILNPAQDNYREYIQIKLIDSFISGVKYCFNFYVSACDSSQYLTNDIGIYFSQTEIHDTCSPLNSTCPLPYIPQFENQATNNLNNRNGWTEITGTYIATGGEEYIIIGNFKDNLATVAIQTGWSVHPIYYFGVYYIDDIFISICDSPYVSCIENIKLYPSLSNTQLIIETDCGKIEQLSIYSMLGQIVVKKDFINTPKISIDVSSIAKGIYIVGIVTNQKKVNIKYLKN